MGTTALLPFAGFTSEESKVLRCATGFGVACPLTADDIERVVVLDLDQQFSQDVTRVRLLDALPVRHVSGQPS